MKEHTFAPKLWVGLGNPGKAFDGHRHNIGKQALMVFSEQYKLNWEIRSKLSAQVANLAAAPGAQSIYLGVSTEYMNNSGVAVKRLLHHFRLNPSDLLILHDELDLPVGQIRLKFSGGLAGHNGLKSIAKLIESHDFWRLRIGIGRPQRQEVPISEYVLSRPDRASSDIIQQMLPSCYEALLTWVEKGQKPQRYGWIQSAL